MALSILSTLTPDQLAQAVADGDSTALSRSPGLGKKGAQKIILELSGKLDISSIGSTQPRKNIDSGSRQVVEGLVSLGWQQHDAEQAVNKVCKENDFPMPLSKQDVPKVLKQALTLLDRGR